jgi:CheY-like chemotaxis protein
MNASLGILLAEDNDDDVFLLKRAFQSAEIQNPLYVAHDGQEAIDYLSGVGNFANRTEYPLPSLVILDLKMPKRTGMEVLQWVRSQPVLHCLPVIMLSSSTHRHDIERAYRLGANAFVAKPTSTEDRNELSRYIKGFWLQFNEPPMLATEGLEAARKLHSQEEINRAFF